MKRVPQLDGVRGLAILLVVTSHMAGGVSPDNRPFFSFVEWDSGGGFIGVQLFFVLSGFLITSILVREWEDRGAISMRGFYARRVRRLVPALVVICAFYCAYLVALDRGAVRRGLGSIFHALTYTTNLDWLLPVPQNGWLRHTWSLAVEEQFYIVWPMLLLLAIALGVKRVGGPSESEAAAPPHQRVRSAEQAIAITAAVGIALTVTLQVAAPYLFRDAVAADLRYNVLRWDALLAGCLLAVYPIRVPRVLGWFAVASIAFVFAWLPPGRPLWAYSLSTVASFLLIARAQQMNWLANPLLRHLGAISYGLYLWHVLVLRFALPGPVSLVLSIGAAELSFWFVERRFLRVYLPGDTDRPQAASRNALWFRRAQPSPSINPTAIE
jgi:peptidoglycan/LPS O-acetylase OafA/YrhL